ncbi:cytochrome P450 6a2-like isoform X1 [Homalodisca vitripennis]|uniref:cytochrome P450 6a2-like isoform X1 n=2 Tax=Homalodisca vitripennis TaxID=197043 RepID=UPI001EEB4EE4|nr:cytochrome P450 6a2-like isoform X1 [Homalodisca vitripennis]XP_046658573.1 cytochrome P450 6a2-like isoform X1 [Homalodisca vitripennis]
MMFAIAVELILLVILCLFLLYKYWTSEYSYWEKRNVPYLKPSFPFGNIKDQVLNTTDVGNSYKNMYDMMPGVKYFGIFELGRPALVLRDPTVIKAILVKDFNHFMDRGHIHEDVKQDFMATGHVFNLKGDKWKSMRSKLTPMFTSGRMKKMYHLMHQLSQKFGDFLKPLAEENSVLEFKDLIARFTTDVISSCALGMETNAITEVDSEVRRVSKLFFPSSIWNAVKLMLSINTPRLYNLLGLEQMDPTVKEFCMQVAKETYNYRTKNNVYRDDFIDLLVKLKQNKNLYEDEKETSQGPRESDGKSDGLTFEEMACQIFVIFAGGFETSSTVSSTALYEMALHPDIQEKVRKEVDEVLCRHDGVITYQALKEMAYVEQVIYEALRRYSPFPILTRNCTKQYQMSDGLVIEKGTRVVIPLVALHHDSDYYPDPYQFDPERFSPENLRNHLGTTSIPFGDGPMVCLGQRFGKMQAKCVIATIISQFELTPVPETPTQLTIDPLQFLTTMEHPILIRLSKRKDKLH